MGPPRAVEQIGCLHEVAAGITLGNFDDLAVHEQRVVTRISVGLQVSSVVGQKAQRRIACATSGNSYTINGRPCRLSRA